MKKYLSRQQGRMIGYVRECTKLPEPKSKLAKLLYVVLFFILVTVIAIGLTVYITLVMMYAVLEMFGFGIMMDKLASKYDKWQEKRHGETKEG